MNESANDEEIDEDIVRIGNFLINVGAVSKNSLKAMRTYWPMEDYRLLKNRKTARMQRARRKHERVDTREELSALQAQNTILRARVNELEQRLLLGCIAQQNLPAAGAKAGTFPGVDLPSAA